MDTSETYIKMCEKAGEIQNEWLNHDTTGDFAIAGKTIDGYHGFWKLEKGSLYIVGNDDEHDLTIEDISDIQKTKAIWLPRQDQLQEMVGKGINSWEGYAYGFGCWCLRHYRNGQMGSMEQLWLSFVMKEKHDKAWNGEDWISSAT